MSDRKLFLFFAAIIIWAIGCVAWANYYIGP